ncbi:hypothetical protein PsYK624_142010 [Phanerochaete sordida]|uniref:Uncharacterized protein n=1 Tax=Phanerochaete sordida TaxID=48140 RepID=A0A9P3GPI7_9APHY|nr:hypothetical protein PsYK624_142010 [Phanerochaete sordida]
MSSVSLVSGEFDTGGSVLECPSSRSNASLKFRTQAFQAGEACNVISSPIVTLRIHAAPSVNRSVKDARGPSYLAPVRRLTFVQAQRVKTPLVRMSDARHPRALGLRHSQHVAVNMRHAGESSCTLQGCGHASPRIFQQDWDDCHNCSSVSVCRHRCRAAGGRLRSSVCRGGE